MQVCSNVAAISAGGSTTRPSSSSTALAKARGSGRCAVSIRAVVPSPGTMSTNVKPSAIRASRQSAASALRPATGSIGAVPGAVGGAVTGAVTGAVSGGTVVTAVFGTVVPGTVGATVAGAVSSGCSTTTVSGSSRSDHGGARRR